MYSMPIKVGFIRSGSKSLSTRTLVDWFTTEQTVQLSLSDS